VQEQVYSHSHATALQTHIYDIAAAVVVPFKVKLRFRLLVLQIYLKKKLMRNFGSDFARCGINEYI